MTDEEQKALNKVEAQYHTIFGKYYAMLDVCGDDEDCRGRAAGVLGAADANLSETQNNIMGKSSASIKKLSKEADKGQASIDKALADLKNIKTVLNTITKVVTKVGEVIAALAI